MSRRKQTLLAVGLLVALAGVGVVASAWLSSPWHLTHQIHAQGAALVRKGMTEEEVNRTLGVRAGDYRSGPSDERQQSIIIKRRQEGNLILSALKRSAFPEKIRPAANPTLKSWISDWGVVEVVFDDAQEVVIAIHSPFKGDSVLVRLRRWLGL